MSLKESLLEGGALLGETQMMRRNVTVFEKSWKHQKRTISLDKLS